MFISLTFAYTCDELKEIVDHITCREDESQVISL